MEILKMNKEVFKYWNHWFLLVAGLMFFTQRCVLEVSAIYWPTTVLEIQHLCPERRPCWGVWTQRPTTLTYTGWSHKRARTITCYSFIKWKAGDKEIYRDFFRVPFWHGPLHISLMPIDHVTTEKMSYSYSIHKILSKSQF